MRRRYALPFLAALLCACERKGMNEDFNLVGTDQGPVPRALREDGQCTHTLRGGTLQLRRDRSWDSGYDIVVSCANRPDSAVKDFGVVGGHYRVFGDTVAMFSPDGQVSGIGVRKGDTLMVSGPGQTVIYVTQ
jgi:hypothetical protein